MYEVGHHYKVVNISVEAVKYHTWINEMESTKVSKAFKYLVATNAQVRITNKTTLDNVLDDVKKKMNTLVKNVDEIIPEYLDVYTNTAQWMEDNDMVKLSLLFILECGLHGKESHSEIKLDHHHHAYDASYGAEPPLTKAHNNIIHEGVDAHHSSPQQAPHRNVHQFEAVSSRQGEDLNKEEDVNKEENESYVNKEGTEDTSAINKMEDTHTEEEDIHKDAKDGEVHMEERPSDQNNGIEESKEEPKVDEANNDELDIGVLGYKRLRRKA
ncbi:hypothetical protein FNV43_RR10422 [Rhamnella rubrinervis]|uniref:Uncharacterized protein n=1 Tax=Rhamnella rubrinervis TaxID=2594499 RepID=A0A8K0MKP7_9ROSA|nr:hypothetical protein FNV43_RR10422 [Rhamnella rubrinervis]